MCTAQTTTHASVIIIIIIIITDLYSALRSEDTEALGITTDSYDQRIRYDSVYLMCSKKLTGRHLSPLHGTNKKLKRETKTKMMSVIGSVQSRYHEADGDHWLTYQFQVVMTW